MFQYVPRRPPGRYDRIVDPRFDPSRATLEERKLEAWALVVGIDVADAYRDEGRRNHRAFLPDVDFSQIEPKPASAWRRFLDRIFR